MLALGVGLWSQLFGMIGFELFGSFTDVFEPADDLVEHQIELGIAALGLDA